MGKGISGGALTGGPTRSTAVIAPSGQSGILASPLGAGATDVVTKVGSTEIDATVNASAKLVSFRTGINGTEVEKAYMLKSGALVTGQLTCAGFTTANSSTMTSGSSLGMSGGGSSTGNIITVGSSSGDRGVLANAIGAATASATIPALDFVHNNGALGANDLLLRARDNSTTNVMSLTAQGTLNLMGTDSSASPGAATINKGTGKSAIALGAASVVITCDQCAATSRVMITPHARDATCKELIVVPAAGSFTVSGSAVATADLPFSWEVSNIL